MFVYDISEYLAKGKKDEDIAMHVIEETLGGKCFRPSNYKTAEYIDIECHTDFFWSSPKGYLCSIDKKSPKKINRLDEKETNEYTWIEIKNVNGKNGSACCQVENLAKIGYKVENNRDYCCYEIDNIYFFIQRIKLENWIKKQIKNKEIVSSNPNQPYIPYQRKNRQDLIVLVPINDIENLSQFEIKIIK